MAVDRTVFENFPGSCTFHVMETPEGPRFRVLYEKGVNPSYGSPELTYEQMLEWALFFDLHKVFEQTAYNPPLIRNLTDAGWWKEGEPPEDGYGDDDLSTPQLDAWYAEHRPEGQVEQWGAKPSFDDHQAITLAADKEAIVALEAIKAYRAYVAAGGDPTQVPAMSFNDGAFAVNIVGRETL